MTVGDLRFGFAPLPAATPGFDPGGDARALLLPGSMPGSPSPVAGEQLFGSLGPGHRFVLKIPAAWNGRFVACGTPAMRSEHANDALYGDALLARGYAYAASNKGIAYNAVWEARGAPDPDAYVVPFRVGDAPPDSTVIRFGALANGRIGIGSWQADLPALVIAARDLIVRRRGRPPERTYALGLSIGGAQVRALLERRPDLVDGGVECASVYWHPERHLLAYLPTFLRHMPAYVASGYRDRDAHDAIVRAGFPPDRLRAGDLPSLWNAYYAALPPFYADLTTFAFARLLDTGAGALDTLAARAAYVPSAAAAAEIAGFAHTGAIGKPLLGIAGDADAFIAPAQHFAPYRAAVAAAGRADRYWQYEVAGGTHVDPFVSPGWDLQPLGPYVLRALERLVAIVEGARPPGAGTVRRVTSPDAL